MLADIKFVNYRIEGKIVVMEHTTIDLETIESSYVLIKIFFCGICNSDIKEIRQERISRKDFGHEIVGEVVSTSHDLESYCTQYVILDPHIEIRRTTGFGEFMLMQGKLDNLKKTLFTISENSRDYILVEPMACAIHALRKTYPVLTEASGQKVLIYGCGTFGYIMYLILRHYNAEVLLHNREKARLEFLTNNVNHAIQVFSENNNQLFDTLILAGSFISEGDLQRFKLYLNNHARVLLFGAVKPEEELFYQIRNQEQS
jgi:threonine dehydrogenase-like Zn-dependent dehydrogenase